MYRRLTLLLVVLLLVAARVSPGQEARDSYGGRDQSRTAATGWFRVLRAEGRWWFADPAGRLFLSAGVEGVSLTPDAEGTMAEGRYREAVQNEYGGARPWAAATVARLKSWGFNTLGARADTLACRQGLPYTLLLDLSGTAAGDGGHFPDVFSPSYEREVNQLARRLCRPVAQDPLLLGYFTDENLHWRPDARDADTMLSQFLRLDDYAPGRQALLRFLQQRYPTLEALNRAWNTGYASYAEIGRVPQPGASLPADATRDFLRLVAERYFRVTQQAVRAADPNHLILGCRFSGGAPTVVLEAMRGRVDVVSVTGFTTRPARSALQEISRVTQRPVLITGFSSRARDSGLLNGKGHGPLLNTQAERGAHYGRYVEELLSLPTVLGYHWHQLVDERAADGHRAEDSNCGLVSIENEPYPAFVTAVTRANQAMYKRALAAQKGKGR